jgi:hypothetical protein
MYGTGDSLAKINETVKPYYGKFNADLWLVEIYVTDVTGKGGELVHRRKSNPGLIKLREVLGFLDKTYRELKFSTLE